jgi:hypothetical protein
VFNIANERIVGTVREETPPPGARVSDMSSGMSFAYSGRSPQLRRRGAAHHEPISSAGIPRRATWIASQDDSVSTVSRQLQDYRGSPSTICGTHGCAQSWHKPEGDQRCGYHIIQDPSEAAARAACCVVRIWEPGATARWREPWRDGSGGRLKVTCAFETGEATRDGDRLARNPEVEVRILSPLPAETPLGDCSGAVFMPLVNDL